MELSELDRARLDLIDLIEFEIPETRKAFIGEAMGSVAFMGMGVALANMGITVSGEMDSVIPAVTGLVMAAPVTWMGLASGAFSIQDYREYRRRRRDEFVIGRYIDQQQRLDD